MEDGSDVSSSPTFMKEESHRQWHTGKNLSHYLAAADLLDLVCGSLATANGFAIFCSPSESISECSAITSCSIALSLSKKLAKAVFKIQSK